MAEQQQANALAAAFPAPPPFWQHFTSENLDRIQGLRKGHTGSNLNGAPSASDSKSPSSAPVVRLLDLPPELRFLQPPEPPAYGSYRCFGDKYNLNDILPTLEDQGIEQLYPPPSSPDGDHSERAAILQKLAKRLLLTFLELVGILSANPALYKSKIDELRTLFINFHHLLNEYRPHHSRESLIFLMEDQLKRSQEETEGILKMKEKVEGMLEGLGQAKLAEDDSMATNDTLYSETEGDLEIWDELDRQFG